MAKGKYAYWLEDAQLEKVANWAAHGCSNEQIASNMGIRRQTLGVWMDKYPSISDAIKKGRARSIEAIENALFKNAIGDVYEEVEVVETLKDGSTRSKVTRKKMKPDTTAQIFYLKNRAPDRWSDRRDLSIDDMREQQARFNELLEQFDEAGS